jgi:hypothetical protein
MSQPDQLFGLRLFSCGPESSKQPSDYPDFARWLVERGITSISLKPDVAIKTQLMIAGFFIERPMGWLSVLLLPKPAAILA